jgi:hypothetical protein
MLPPRLATLCLTDTAPQAFGIIEIDGGPESNLGDNFSFCAVYRLCEKPDAAGVMKSGTRAGRPIRTLVSVSHLLKKVPSDPTN